MNTNSQTNTDLLSVLTREGVLINASVRYPRFHKKLKAADLGLEPDQVNDRLLSLGHKKLLPKEALAELALIESRTHAIIDQSTFPFLGGIGHFLPNAKLVDVQERLNSQNVCFQNAKDQFLRSYPQLRADALNEWETATRQIAKTYDEAETLIAQIEGAFPASEFIESKFAFQLHLFQIAVPEDLGIELLTFAEQNEVRQARHEAARSASREIRTGVENFIGECVTELRGQTAQLKQAPFLLPIDQLRNQTRNAKVNDIIDIGLSNDAPAASEFPVLPAFRATPIPLTKDITTSLLRAMACSSHDETRHLLRGAFIDVTGSGKNAHRIIATDGRHLFSSNSMHLPQIKSPVILPDHKLWKWRLIAESRPWTLRISPLKNSATLFRINGPNWCVTGKTIEGSYPNYRQVVPQPEEFKTHVHLSNAALDSMIELIPTFPGKKLNNRPVGIWMQRGNVSLLARETNDEPWKVYPVGKCEVKGPDVKVLVNRDYLIKSARFGLNEMAIVDDMSPLRFTRGSDLMIVMPIRNTGSDQVAGVRQRPQKPEPKAQPREQSTVKRTTDPLPVPVPATPDPIEAAEVQIAEAKQALDAAGGSLKTVRQQRETDQKELGGFRSLFNSIKRFATGGK